MPTPADRAGPPQRPARGVRPARPPPPPSHLYRNPVPDPRTLPHQRPPPPPRTAPPRPTPVTHTHTHTNHFPTNYPGGGGGGGGGHGRVGGSTGWGRRSKWCGKAASWAWLPLSAAARVESAITTCWPPTLAPILACLPCLASSDSLSLEEFVAFKSPTEF
ncbi:hypothetical protein Pcinc_043454 [Petrolisthes cinctipes]|uniref:Uncharacterized protein n=1 Tax=Petrolisthes cinctipes TaxID=88211 RepID=A0AAE1EHV5_PETCI|nr:hypothetical protein Pcinc_043454 [Petrolisthes cinctipes]